MATRELRNNTAGVLRRVEAGESIVITVRGKPVADLVPHEDVRPRWLTPSEVLAIREVAGTDPTFRADLDRLAGEMTSEDSLDELW